MKRRILVMGVAILLVGFARSVATLSGALTTHHGGISANGVVQERVKQQLASLPLNFIENRGQVDSSVSHYLQGADTSVYFTPGGLTYALADKTDRLRKFDAAGSPDRTPGEPVFGAGEESAGQHTLELDFVGANSVVPTALHKNSTAISYFKGPAEQWKTGVPTYSKLIYKDLWPGIDLVYSGTEKKLKYDFHVKAGADPSKIRLAYRGASAISVNPKGQLKVSTPKGGLTDDRPYSFQAIKGKKVKVQSSYDVSSVGPDGAQSFGFSVGEYDRTKALVIDPAVLLYAGYIGGALADADDTAKIAVDKSGAAYITGRAKSTESSFPVTGGPGLAHKGDLWDAFVAKVNPSGTSLEYAGYIGGDATDWGSDIAVGDSGAAYIAGSTRSNQASFPVNVGPDLTYNSVPVSGAPIPTDAFVAKVNPSGTSLEYAGYIGGAARDTGSGIALDGSGAAYVTGSTDSNEATFPVNVGPDLTYNSAPTVGFDADVFVAKVNPSGIALDYAGYIGGAGVDQSFSIAADAEGAVYVSGVTRNTAVQFNNAAGGPTNFPVTVGPDLTYNGGVSDAFVAKVNPAGTALVYSGYIGGLFQDEAYAIAVDTLGAAYVTGNTISDQNTFPAAAGPDRTHNGSLDAFAVKVNPTGSALDYAGYIGGFGQESGYGIAVDGSGAAYVTGTTNSRETYTNPNETRFPVAVGPDLTYNGGEIDAFVAKVSPAGNALEYAGYIGGDQRDGGYGIAIDGSGTAYVAGHTVSSEQTFPVIIGPDLTHNSLPSATGDDRRDGFVAKISATGPISPVPTLLLSPESSTGPIASSHAVTATLKDPAQSPLVGTKVKFSVAGATPTVAPVEVITNANGKADFSYMGLVPGQDTITAFADFSGEGLRQLNEPEAVATRMWILPGPGDSGPGSPSISSLDPPTGPVAGGTRVMVNGANLNNAQLVLFGSKAVSQPCGAGQPSGESPCFNEESPSRLTVYSPSVPAPTRVHVRVANSAGLWSAESSADLFEYTLAAPPKPDPSPGPGSGGLDSPGPGVGAGSGLTPGTPGGSTAASSSLSANLSSGQAPVSSAAPVQGSVQVPSAQVVQAPAAQSVPGQVAQGSGAAGAAFAAENQAEGAPSQAGYFMVGKDSQSFTASIGFLFAGMGMLVTCLFLRPRRGIGPCTEPTAEPAPSWARC